MTYGEVKELITMIDTSTLTEFELSLDNVSVKMSKNTRNFSDTANNETTTAAKTNTAAPQQMPQKTDFVPTETDQKPQDAEHSLEKDESGEMVKAPIVGTFYAGPGGGKGDFVKVGDKVKEGDTLCILEAMKIMNEISSPVDGEIAEIYVSNENMVEYGQPLFRIK